MNTPRFDDAIKGAHIAADELQSAYNMIGEFERLLRDVLPIVTKANYLTARRVEYVLKAAAKNGFIPHPRPDYGKLMPTPKKVIDVANVDPAEIKAYIAAIEHEACNNLPNTGLLPPLRERYVTGHPTGAAEKVDTHEPLAELPPTANRYDYRPDFGARTREPSVRQVLHQHYRQAFSEPESAKLADDYIRHIRNLPA